MAMVNLGSGLGALASWLANRVGRSLVLASLGMAVIAVPSHSAEEIIITYGFFERTIAIKDLEAFAEGNGLSRQLAIYARDLGLTEAELNTIQRVLNERADLSQVDVAQFLYTLQGETLLDLVGAIIQTPSRQPGFYAIRSSLILAAADEEVGLTIINVLKKYPTPEIRLDIGKGLEVAGAIAQVLNASDEAIALVQQKSAAVAQLPAANLLGTRQLFNDQALFTVQTVPLFIPARGIVSTLYLPQSPSPSLPLPAEIPVIVISHGLGDERASYDYLARYLAQRGFFVATLDHPGSNAEKISQLLGGLTPNLIENQEFINRPYDVSALLDEIEQFAMQNATLRSRLNIQNVGLIGQSFGGYTALALGGATFNSATLEQSCEPQPIYLNPSLLLQCQASEIAAAPPPLKDDRVQAILVVNPIGSSIFGESGYGQLEIPVMIMAATGDTVAPALPEQIRPFTWLQTPARYLVLTSRTTHFSVIAFDPNATPAIPVPPALLGSSPELAQEYLQVLSLAFFARHLQQDERFAFALTPQYINEFVARSPLEPLSIIEDLTPAELQTAISASGKPIEAIAIDWQN